VPGTGVTVQDRHGELVYCNELAALMCGAAEPAEIVGRPAGEVTARFELLDADGEPLPLEVLPGRAVLRGERAAELLVRFRARATNEEHWVAVSRRARPRRARHRRRGDQHPRRRHAADARGAPRLLADASRVLGSSLDYDRTLGSIARLAVPGLADVCLIDLLEGGELRRVAVAHREGGLTAASREIEARYPPSLDSNPALARVVRSGEPTLIPRVDDAFVDAIARSPEHRELLRALGLGSVMLVPLVARRRPVGVLVLATTTSGRRYGDDDLAFAVDLAARAATAVDNALLYRESELARRRLALQNEVAAVLADVCDPLAASRRVIEAVCADLGGDAGAIWRVEGGVLRCENVWTAAGLSQASELVELSRSLELYRGEGLPGRIWESGRPLWIEDLAAAADLPRRAAMLAAGLSSSFGFPLCSGGLLIGVLELASRRRRPPDEALLATLPALGSTVGLFLDRVRADEARAQLLQREQEARAEAESAADALRRLEVVTQAALEHALSGDLVDELLGQIAVLLDADTSAILLMDEARTSVKMAATHGFSGEVEHAVAIPLGQGFAGRIALGWEPVVVEDLDQIELVSPVLRERGVRSLVAIPIRRGEHIPGVAHAGSLEPGHFTARHVRLLQLVADRLAGAIAQAQLYERERAAWLEAERAQQRLQFLAEASEVLASSLDYTETLPRVAQLAVPRLADSCAVHVCREDGSIEVLSVSNENPEAAADALRLARASPVDPAAVTGVPAVVRDNRSELDEEQLERLVAERPGQEARLRALLGASAIAVPLRGRAGVLGAITLLAVAAQVRARRPRLRRGARGACGGRDRECPPVSRRGGARAGGARARGGGRRRPARRPGGSRALLEPRSGGDEGSRRRSRPRPAGRRGAPRLVRPRVADPRRGRPGRSGRQTAAETIPLELADRELWLSVSGVGFDERDRVRLPRPDAGQAPGRAEERVRGDRLAGAADAAHRRLRRRDDAAASRPGARGRAVRPPAGRARPRGGAAVDDRRRHPQGLAHRVGGARALDPELRRRRARAGGRRGGRGVPAAGDRAAADSAGVAARRPRRPREDP